MVKITINPKSNVKWEVECRKMEQWPTEWLLLLSGKCFPELKPGEGLILS